MTEDDAPPVRIPIEEILDLHTFSPRDVPGLVRDYLEEAARRKFREVRIVHGKGTGVLKEAVRSVLARHPGVASFADAPPEAGGWGATVVSLKAGSPPPISGR